jgi:hypothetical protein
MLKSLVTLLLGAGVALAGGAVPSVNSDMGCTATGQGLVYNGASIICQAAQRPSVTVSGLPTCNAAAQGLMYMVTDALAPVALAAVASGGAVKIGVTCNGASWIVQ